MNYQKKILLEETKGLDQLVYKNCIFIIDRDATTTSYL